MLSQLSWGYCKALAILPAVQAGLSTLTMLVHMQVDATDFSEIATTCMEGRCVLDLCVDAADSFIGIVSVEPNELMPSSARVYEVGRQRIQVRTLPHGLWPHRSQQKLKLLQWVDTMHP